MAMSNTSWPPDTVWVSGETRCILDEELCTARGNPFKVSLTAGVSDTIEGLCHIQLSLKK